MKKSTMMMAVALAIGLGVSAKAEERSWAWSPIGIGLAAPIQLPPVMSDVYGLRLGGFFGYNHDVYGLDLGVAEVCSGGFRGLQVSALSWDGLDWMRAVFFLSLASRELIRVWMELMTLSRETRMELLIDSSVRSRSITRGFCSLLLATRRLRRRRFSLNSPIRPSSR